MFNRNNVVIQIMYDGLLYQLVPLPKKLMEGSLLYIPKDNVVVLFVDFSGLFSCIIKCTDNCSGHTFYTKDVQLMQMVTTKEPEFAN